MLEQEVAELAAELMEHADSNHVRIIYRDGLSKIIDSFSDDEGAQQAIRVLEEHTVLNALVSEVMETLPTNKKAGDDVQVVIAGGGRYDDLSHLSMVLKSLR